MNERKGEKMIVEGERVNVHEFVCECVRFTGTFQKGGVSFPPSSLSLPSLFHSVIDPSNHLRRSNKRDIRSSSTKRRQSPMEREKERWIDGTKREGKFQERYSLLFVFQSGNGK